MSLPSKSQLASVSDSWSARYGKRHRLERIIDFPQGITAPERIRLYRRRDHFVLQWWDPREKRTLSDRVNGDLVAAIAYAREIERRMTDLGRSGLGVKRLTFAQLIDSFLADAARRAGSAEIDPRSVARYRSALNYLREFSGEPDIVRSYSHPARADRSFVQQFAAFLQEKEVSPNGHAHTNRRPMRGQYFVLQAVRALFSWAADPERGNLLPVGFHSPFKTISGCLRRPRLDLTRKPPITVTMASDFIQTCDDYQFKLFLPLILFGLRAEEPVWIFGEDVEHGWLNVRCHPEFGHLTKGQRDKRFPLVESLSRVWVHWLPTTPQGLLLRGRQFVNENSGRQSASESFDTLVMRFRARCQKENATNVLARRKIRDLCMKESGALTYDQIDQEFRRISKKLGWKATATLKGFRHLFATALENSGCPETYRRFFLGHSPGHAASVNYTHLDQLERHFQKLLDGEYSEIVTAILSRPAS